MGSNPIPFYETCLFGWAAASAWYFKADQPAAYRARWHESEAIAGSCNDYRATLSVDLEDQDRPISAPALTLYGAFGAMARLYDIPAACGLLCAKMEARVVAGGHFFPDIDPAAVVDHLVSFFQGHPLEGGRFPEDRRGCHKPFRFPGELAKRSGWTVSPTTVIVRATTARPTLEVEDVLGGERGGASRPGTRHPVRQQLRPGEEQILLH